MDVRNNTISPISGLSLDGRKDNRSPLSGLSMDIRNNTISPISGLSLDGRKDNMSPLSGLSMDVRNNTISPISGLSLDGRKDNMSPLSRLSMDGRKNTMSPLSGISMDGRKNDVQTSVYTKESSNVDQYMFVQNYSAVQVKNYCIGGSTSWQHPMTWGALERHYQVSWMVWRIVSLRRILCFVGLLSIRLLLSCGPLASRITLYLVTLSRQVASDFWWLSWSSFLHVSQSLVEPILRYIWCHLYILLSLLCRLPFPT